MDTNTRPHSHARRAALIAGLVGALAVGLWIQFAGSKSDADLPPAEPLRIPESGRLHVREGDLPDREEVTIVIPLPIEARGETPRPVRVASTDGRRVETTGAIGPGPQSEIRFDLERDWLEPSGYLIEVTTTEKTALPIRRFVLQVE